MNVADIPGIEDTSLELLEVAGFRDLDSLAKAGVDSLANELTRANEILKIAEESPSRESVEAWIRAAREALGEIDEKPVTDSDSMMPTDFEAMPELAPVLDEAPCAIPFSGRQLAEAGIPVGEVVPGILLNRYTGDLEVRIDDRQHAESETRQPANQYIQVAEKPRAERHEIDVSRLRSIEEYARQNASRGTGRGLRRRESSGGDDKRFIREPRPETNAGRNVNSRRYIRGVLHTEPWLLRTGAVFTMILFVVIPLSLAITPMLLLHDGDPDAYHWVRPWWVVFPFLVPLFGICWLLWAYPCSCRICRQRLFVPMKHRKNAKAHRIPLLGYILPLAMHLLAFHWFRCTHCGTPVRLKK